MISRYRGYGDHGRIRPAEPADMELKHIGGTIIEFSSIKPNFKIRWSYFNSFSAACHVGRSIPALSMDSIFIIVIMSRV